MKTSLFGLLAAVVVAGCTSSPEGGTRVAVAPGARRAFARTVIGVNHLAYGGNGLGYGMILKKSHTLDPELVAWQREIGFGSLRYPGGCGGTHLFDWKKNAGLAGGYNVMGVVEFLDMCEKAGAEPILGISAHRGTPAEAAEYVEFLNAPATAAHPWAQKRAARGHAAPYGAVWFEYGNETYHGRTCSTYKKRPELARAPITPETYVTNYLAFRAAMKAVDPKIRLGAPLLGKGSTWDSVVLAALAKTADFFVVHTYAQVPEREKDDYLSLFTDRADFLTKRFASVKEAAGRDVPICVTEFNARQVQHRTLTSALVNLETLMTFAEEPCLAHADFWQFVNEGFGMVRGEHGAFVKRPNAWAFQLYSKYMKDLLVPSAVTAPKTVAPRDPLYPEAWRGRNAAAGAKFSYREGGKPQTTGSRYERLADGTHKLTFLDDREQNFFQLGTELKGLPAGDHCLWKVSYEMWTVAEGRPFGMQLEMVDGRGWGKTKSAAAGDLVSGVDPVEVNFTYAPLKDNPGSLILRFRGRGKGSVYMRNLRVEAVEKRRGSAPAVRAQLTVAKDGRTAAGVFLNRSFEPQPVRVATRGLLADGAIVRAARGEVLTGPSAYATNEEKPDNVIPKPFAAEVRDGVVTFTLPPYAAVGLELEAK